ncbi:uncharacterized protein BO97DRAFT_426423 [Aspergillus homomorphus CBS 101889]|uniref:Uncharacterized protein n=1 Tax=Aspergillus homomorphus (strain CBS 101889) TaxID=1450537 RepID=A0A395HS86_ASPHC|nr:hypothetical protein BO97DRAFT_426423 [Aspergillus homomorphus CBS 101889]RAL10406.1 hypothetical protein BO97DRAFT_426423 [Aspergillus homomorphus CBS 101889]
MRSGLQKPGAIPFLALLIFSLLSLVPSLAKDWDYHNLPFGHIGYLRSETRHISRAKDSWADVRSRLRMTGGQSKSWLIEGYRQTNPDRKSRPRRPPTDAPSRGSFEAPAILDSDPMAYLAQDSSSAFTRGVRALKALVIRQLDDPQLNPSFPAEIDSSTGQLSTRLSPLFANTSLNVALSHNEDLSRLTSGGGDGDRTIIDTTNLVDVPKWLLSCVRTSWQQACRVGSGYVEIVTGLYGYRDVAGTTSCNCSETMNTNDSSRPRGSRKEAPLGGSLPALPMDENTQAGATTSAVLTESVAAPTQPPPPTATEQPKAVERQAEPERMRSGSCMAIVIAIVAGVMWF